MNKCPFCGANVDIETPFCPYCGNSKEQYKEHREDMNRYKKAYAKVENEVVHENRKTVQGAAAITIILVLILLISLCFVGISNSYSISTYLHKKSVEKHYDEHAAMMDQYIANRDYYGLNEYFNDEMDLYISYDSKFLDYQDVTRFAGMYVDLHTYIQQSMILPEQYPTYNERAVSYCADKYNYLMEEYERYSNPDPSSYNYSAGRYSTEKAAAIDDMKAQIDACLILYFKLTDEEFSEFENGSDAKRKVILEEKYQSLKNDSNSSDTTSDNNSVKEEN